MNNQSQIPYIKDGKKWYFLSVFYAKENWTVLIDEIKLFFETRQGQFSNYHISFSKEQGEQLQITFVTVINDNNNYSKEIQTYFQAFLDKNPSKSKVAFPYGKIIWANYPNNSLAWNKFCLLNYSDYYTKFYKTTIDIAILLLEGNFSDDNIFSIGSYLIIKAIDFIEKNQQINILANAYHEACEKYPFYVDTVLKQINAFDVYQVRNIFNSYKNESENQIVLESWIDTLITSTNINKQYLELFFIGKIIGLSVLRQMIILGLIIKCNNLCLSFPAV